MGDWGFKENNTWGLTPICGILINKRVQGKFWSTRQIELIDLPLVTKLAKQDFAHPYTYLQN